MKNYNILICKPTILEGTGPHTATSWEIRSTTDTDSVTNLIHHSYKNATNLYQYRINLDLGDDDVIYVRTKYHFGERESKWSNVISIKGEQKGYKLSNIIIGTPIVSYEFDLKSDKVNQLVLKASDMTIFTGYGNHISTSWVITDSDGKVVYERLKDTDNLNELVLNLDMLDLSKTYIVKVKFHTDTNGTSRYGKVVISESHTQGSLFDMRLLTRPTIGRVCTAEVILKTVNFASASLRMVSSTGAILTEVLDQPTLYPSFPIARLDDGSIDITAGRKPLLVEPGQDIVIEDTSKYDYIIVEPGAKIRIKDELGRMTVINGYAFVATRSSSKRPIDLETPGFESIYVLNNVIMNMDTTAEPISVALGSTLLDRRPNGQTLVVEPGEIKTIDKPTDYDTIIVHKGGRVQWLDIDNQPVKIEGYSYIVGRNITRTPSYIEDAGYDNVYVVKDSNLTISNVDATEDFISSNNISNVGENVKIYGRIKLKDGTTTGWKLLYFGNIQDISVMSLDTNTEYLGKHSYSGEINFNGYTVQTSRELNNNDVLYAKYGLRTIFRGSVYNNRIIESGRAFDLPPEYEYSIQYVNIIPTYSDAILVNFAVMNSENYKSSVWARYIIDPETGVYTYDRHIVRDNELYSTAVNGSAVACRNGYVYYIPTRMRDGTSLAIWKINIDTMQVIKEENLPFTALRDVSLCMLPDQAEFIIFSGNHEKVKRIGNEDIHVRENNTIWKYNVEDRTFARAGSLEDVSEHMYSFQAVLRKDGKITLFNSVNQGPLTTVQNTLVYDPETQTVVLEDNDHEDEHPFRNTFALQDGDILRVSSKEFNSMACYDYISNTLNPTQVDVPDNIERGIQNLKINPGENITIEDPTRYGHIIVERGGSITFLNKDISNEVVYGKSLIITSNIATPIAELNFEDYDYVYVIDDRSLTVVSQNEDNEG